METPGILLRSLFERVICSRVTRRYMERSTRSLMCCNGMSMYLATLSHSAMASIIVGEVRRIAYMRRIHLTPSSVFRVRGGRTVNVVPNVGTVTRGVLADRVDLHGPVRDHLLTRP